MLSRAHLLPVLLAAPLACEADPPRESLRGDRYCEILIGLADLDAGTVEVSVYNTYGLGDCPADAWAAVDADAIADERGADVVILNGPRHWTLDGFDRADVVDPAIVDLGGLDMREAGVLILDLADVAMADRTYQPRTVERDTVFRFHAGEPVYELVGPDDAVYVMQSYSDQVVVQDLDALADLGDVLMPPPDWAFRTRILADDLLVTAVDGRAVVVQDERRNTYQRLD